MSTDTFLARGCDEPLATGCLTGGRHWLLVEHDDNTTDFLVAETGLPANPADLIECGTQQFHTEEFIVVGPFNNLTGVGVKIVNGALMTGLHSWYVRAATAGVTLTVNGVSFVMDVNEVVASSAQDGWQLNDTIQVTVASAGQRANMVIVRRA